MQKLFFVAILFIGLTLSRVVLADDPPKTPEDLERDAAIEKFTQKMIDANYPDLFEKAAKEFGVPKEILMGVSFAETRWEHLQWPEGETVSPENGMPRPYGIMSLWDNEFFGHSLIEAAKLIGKSPEDLKNDPLDNMRGAAALMKKIYDETAKPEGTKAEELESWRYAIATYSGIPEPDLKNQHAFDVYDWLDQGYNQYGIKIDKVPNLRIKEMWAEVKKIKDEEAKKREAKLRAEGRWDDQEIHSPDEVGYKPEAAQKPATKAVAKTTETPAVAVVDPVAKSSSSKWMVVGAIAALLLSFFIFRKNPQSGSEKKQNPK